MKKWIPFKWKRNACRTAGRMATAALLFAVAACQSVTVKAAGEEEAGGAAAPGEEQEGNQEQVINQVISYVYHAHLGNSEVKGGCYQTIRYHEHRGNETDGGECYGKPVYHYHSGNETEGGICYQTPICHVHTGDPEAGGGCFVPVYHSHVGSCYKTISSSEYGCYTVKWWNTSDGDYEGHDYKYYQMSCGQTIHGTNSSHGHTITECNKGNTIERYTIGCGKTEETPESWVFDCTKNQGLTVDSYEFDCEKTEETIDGYDTNCGELTDEPIGKITLTEYQGENKKESRVEAIFEDCSDGTLKLQDNPYYWIDGSGSQIAEGTSLTVHSNGDYTFGIRVYNEDVNPDSLKADIPVSSIVMPPKGDGSGGSGDGGSGGGSDGSGGGGSSEGGGSGEDTQGTASPSPSVTPSASPSESPSATPKTSSGKSGRGNGGNSDDGSGSGNRKASSGKQKGIPVPTVSPADLKETESVDTETLLSQNDTDTLAVQDLKEQNALQRFLSSDTARVIGITAGSLLIVGGLLLLIYLLMMSIRVYNDDGTGKLHYLGRCRIQLQEDGYAIRITDAMMEKSMTNRYVLRPDLFGILKKDEELIVRKANKSTSATIDREMIVLL